MFVFVGGLYMHKNKSKIYAVAMPFSIFVRNGKMQITRLIIIKKKS